MPKTKFIRVATSGPTIDGREITPAQIDQMAASYSPAKYTARVWMEHLRSMLPDSPFKAYGDVLAVKADTVEDGKRALFAQVDATADLVKMSADRQKVFWSIEVIDNFADTGGAYLAGLAVTDSPASLGTEMLTFAVKSDKLPATLKSHLFTAAEASPLEIEDEPKETGPSLLSKVKDLLGGKSKTDEARFAQIETAVTEIAAAVATVKAAPGSDAFASTDAVKALSADLAALKTGLESLTTKLSTTSPTPPRPPAGGVDATQTDC